MKKISLFLMASSIFLFLPSSISGTIAVADELQESIQQPQVETDREDSLKVEVLPYVALTSSVNLTYNTAEQYVNKLLSDDSITISNVSFSGSNKAASTFSNGLGTLGIDEGIILSTGEVQDQNSSLGQPGDSDLNALTGKTTYDAVSIEFDFIPKYSSLTFDYIFGSKEYPNYVNKNKNDTFAFFVNGVNAALIPGTNDFVSIDNVNSGKNTAYFISNVASPPPLGDLPGTVFGGITTKLPINATVLPNVTNHIKIVIADGGDYVWDSFVAIAANSFKSTGKVNVHFQDEQGNTLHADSSIDGNIGDPYSVVPVVIQGYEFSHWVGSSTGTIPTSSIDVIAVYKKKISIDFVTNGGSLVNGETFAVGTIPTKPANPTRPGYTFEGWYGDSAFTTPFDFTQPVTTDTTVYAKWKKNISGGGSVSTTTPSNTASSSNVPTGGKSTCETEPVEEKADTQVKQVSGQSIVKRTGSSFSSNIAALVVLVTVSLAGTVVYSVKIEQLEATMNK